MKTKLKRPHTVEEWSNIYKWPENAIAELHKGFKVTIVPNDLWNIRLMQYDEPFTKYADRNLTIPLPPKTETMVRVETLHNQARYFSRVRETDQTVELAAGMNRLLKKSSPEKVFIQQDSYKLRKLGLLAPKWTLKTSIRYWTLKLLKLPIQWDTFNGTRTIELSLMVNVGVLSGKQNNSIGENNANLRKPISV